MKPNPKPPNLWPSFLLFIAVNSLLAYSSLTFTVKILIGAAGLGIPFLFLLIKKHQEKSPFPVFQEEFLPRLSGWIWLPLISAALFLRFTHLTSYLGFPIFDEVINAFYAVRLTEHWDWHPFFFTTQLPPFYIWLLSLSFKPEGCSLEALWFLPALLSTAGCFLSYFTSRKFFSASFSFLVFLFTAFSFWPLYLGRFSHQAVLMFFWEWLGLWLLGWFWKTPDSRNQILPLGLLGLCLGLGFYTYFAWALLALPLAFAAVVLVLSRPNPWRKLIFFGTILLAAMIPILLSASRGEYGSYFKGLLVFHAQAANHGWDFFQSLHYFSVIFWRTFEGYFSYGPAWGGFLNPIQSGLFFLGLLTLWPQRRRPLVWGMGLTAFFCYIPILFTNVFNALRLTPLIPLVLVVVAAGLGSLIRSRSGRREKIALMGLLILSLGLDAVNLGKSRSEINRRFPAQKPPVYIEAFEILKQIRDQKGPGLIFSSFVVNEIPEPFLPVADYSFNCVSNPRLSTDSCSWTAVLTNVHYRPFLDKQFPGARVYWLEKEKTPSDRSLMLWVYNLQPGQKEPFLRWKAAADSLKPFLERNMDRTPGEPVEALLSPLREAYSKFQGDPFLEACFWERVSNLYFTDLMLGSLKKSTGEEQIYMPTGIIPTRWIDPVKFKNPIQALEDGIKKGYPAAHLYYRLGVYHSMAGEGKEAKKYFEAAVKAPIDFTDAAKRLKEDK